MLTKTMMQKIQDLKLQGFTEREIAGQLAKQGEKVPSLPTIRKYYRMDILPDDPGSHLVKDKAFDAEPFRSTVIEVLRNNENNKKLCISSIYDVLEEKYVDSGQYEELPGNQQTLRNYVRYLRENDIVASEPKNTRIYDYVPDTPPGEQMLIDFGEQKIKGGVAIHFICLLLRFSRYLLVFAQDHPFNAEEACQALYRCFCRLGGRPKVLVLDQDSVFIADETYGEIVKTRVFEDFCTEQDLKLWVCHKADPESKGPIENSVGFVKKNFFSARDFSSLDEVLRSLPGWCSRKNRRIHQTTYCIPEIVFAEHEQKALMSPVPSLYENSPASFLSVELCGIPYIQYKTNKYSVPRSHAFGKVFYKAVGSYLYVYDDTYSLLCRHAISECHGRVIRLPEHRREPSTDWVSTAERLRDRWNCYDFQHFINGVKKENPRYLKEQLSAIEEFLDREAPSRAMVAAAMKYACEKYRYSFKQFKTVFQLIKSGQLSDNTYQATDVQKQDLSFYAEAFRARMVR